MQFLAGLKIFTLNKEFKKYYGQSKQKRASVVFHTWVERMRTWEEPGFSQLFSLVLGGATGAAFTIQSGWSGLRREKMESLSHGLGRCGSSEGKNNRSEPPDRQTNSHAVSLKVGEKLLLALSLSTLNWLRVRNWEPACFSVLLSTPYRSVSHTAHGTQPKLKATYKR